MRTFLKSILFTGVLATVANGLMAAQASDSWLDQWYRAKYGRSSPTTETRQRAERENTAFREESASQSVTPANAWFEQRYKAKFGRSSPIEEARLRAEQANTAFPEEPAPAVARPANEWLEQWYKAKYGRSSSLVEPRERLNAK